MGAIACRTLQLHVDRERVPTRINQFVSSPGTIFSVQRSTGEHMTNTHSRYRRKLTLVAGFTTAALALAGCAGTASDNPDDDASNDTSTSQEAGGSGEPVPIDVWGWNPDEASAPAYIYAFEAANPDFKVNYRFIQNQDYF